ncbi:hypothetical protein ACOMHN_056486 [Nucella lapillus]
MSPMEAERTARCVSLRLSRLKHGPTWDLRAYAPLHVRVWRGSASRDEVSSFVKDKTSGSKMLKKARSFRDDLKVRIKRRPSTGFQQMIPPFAQDLRNGKVKDRARGEVTSGDEHEADNRCHEQVLLQQQAFGPEDSSDFSGRLPTSGYSERPLKVTTMRSYTYKVAHHQRGSGCSTCPCVSQSRRSKQVSQ